MSYNLLVMSKTASIAVAGAVLFGVALEAQQLEFSSRSYIDAPLSLVSIQSSTDYGFETVTMRNDAPQHAVAVELQVVVSISGSDEIADRRRVVVNLDSQETRKITVGMGQTKGIRDLLSERKQPAGLAVITVEAVEFRDGSQWKKQNTNLHFDAPDIKK